MTTDENKPRHWWLHLQRSPYHSQIFLNSDLTTESTDFRKRLTHVIEYSAYEKLQAEIERLKKEIDNLQQYNDAAEWKAQAEKLASCLEEHYSATAIRKNGIIGNHAHAAINEFNKWKDGE